MSELPLADRTITEVAAALRRRDVSSRELTDACLERIERDATRLNTFLALDPDGARQRADAADAELARRRERRSAAARHPVRAEGHLRDPRPRRRRQPAARRHCRRPPAAASWRAIARRTRRAAQERLDAAGAVLLGKTNCDEFAMGSSNENSAYGPVRNPWDETTVPGGSSGGSSAAVAAGQAFFALGTDTGGSIRQPASLTGTVGMKPTYGRVSRYGMVAFASSLDQCGPLARCVRDAALVLGAVAGHDPRDSTSVDTPVPDYTAALGGEVRGVRLGVPREFFVPGMEPGVEAAVRAALDVLSALGAEIVDVSLPSTDRGLATYYIIAPAEASANLARYDGVRYGLSSADARAVGELRPHPREAGSAPR